MFFTKYEYDKNYNLISNFGNDTWRNIITEEDSNTGEDSNTDQNPKASKFFTFEEDSNNNLKYSIKIRTNLDLSNILPNHYNFTNEELNSIINCNIKDFELN